MPIRDRMTYVALKIFPRRAKSSRIEKGSNGMSLGGRGAIAENVESGLACLLANRGIRTEGAGPTRGGFDYEAQAWKGPSVIIEPLPE